MKFVIYLIAFSLTTVYVAGIEPNTGSSEPTVGSSEPTVASSESPPAASPELASAPSLTYSQSYTHSYTPLPLCCPPCPQQTCSRDQSTDEPPELKRELLPGQQGSIQVRCDGGIVLQFFVEYKIRNQKIRKESGTFTHTLKRTIDIPAEAEDILVTVQRVIGIVTSDIMTRQWKYPVIRCYSSVDGLTAKKVGCN